MRLVNIGYGNMLASERLVAVVSPDAAPAEVEDAVGLLRVMLA